MISQFPLSILLQLDHHMGGLAAMREISKLYRFPSFLASGNDL
jgi:hypothetical protein